MKVTMKEIAERAGVHPSTVDKVVHHRVGVSDEVRARVQAIINEMGDGVRVQRYKGLGEMDPQQLWETTMDPEHRTLLQVTMEDAAAADETFALLMGEKVEPRREFIERNAKYVMNLDV